MKKIVFLAIISLILLNPALAADIELEVDLSPDNPVVGDDITIDAEAFTAGGEVIHEIRADWGEGDNVETCEVSECERSWTFEASESGTKTLEVTAINSDPTVDPKTETRTIHVSEERERYAQFVDFPSNWEVGESESIEAEAFDSEGQLYDQDFEIRVRERHSGYWGSWSTVATEHCWFDPGLGDQYLENCSVEGTFEPESDNLHQMQAFIETSDDGYLLYDRERFTPEDTTPEEHLLTVTVRDGDSNRLQDAKVEVNGETRSTNSRGIARFDLENGEYDIEASKTGYVSDSDTVEIDGEDESINLALERDDEDEHLLTVNVNDEGSDSIQDATVKVDGEEKKTNFRGRARFDLTDGDYDVEVSKPGYHTASESVKIEGGDESIDITLQKEDEEEHLLTVNVKDENNNRIRDATVEVSGEEKTTNSRGRARFELVDGDYDVEASKSGYSSDSGAVEIDGADKSITLNLESLEDEEYRLTVTVRDDSSNRVQNARVNIDGTEKTTNSRGIARFDLEEGWYTAEASKSGYHSDSISFRISEDRSLDLNLVREDDGTLGLSLNSPANGAEVTTPFRMRWSSSHRSENPTHTVYVKRHGAPGSLWDSQYREAYVGTSTSYWFERSLRSGSYDWGVKAEAGGDTQRERRSFVIPRDVTDLDADFSYNPSRPEIGESISFDASGSTGDIVDYSWRMGDGSTNSGREITHSYSSSGWYTVRLTVEDSSGRTDTRTRTVRVEDRERTGNIDVHVEDDRGNSIRNAKVTAMALTPSNFAVRSSSKDSYSTGSSSSRVGDYDIGFDLDGNELETHAEYHSGYNRHTWNNMALESSGGDQLVFRYDLAADSRTGTYREYGASQSVELSSGEKDITVILTLNGDEVGEFTSRIDVPNQHEFQKQRRSGSTSYEGRDTRVSSPSLPKHTRYTDRYGEASFNVPAGRYTVTATKPGYTSDRTNVNVDEGETRNAYLVLDRTDEREPRDPEDPEDPDEPDREEITVQSISLPASVCRGENLQARITFENTGNQDIDYAVSAEGLGSSITRIYYLEAGERETKVISFPEVQGSGNERISFQTEYESKQRTVQVRDCERQQTRGISASVTPSQVRIGQSVKVSGFLYGDVADRRGKEVDIKIDNRVRQSASTEADGRYQAYVRPNRVGEQDIVVESESHSRTRRIDVLPTVSVHSVSAPDRAFEGEEIDICADVESQTAALVLLKKDGEVIESKNGRGEVCFERRETPGNYEFEIQALNRGASDSAMKQIEVFESDLEARSFPEQIASVRSGSGMVRVELYNTHNELRNYEVELEGIPRDWTSQSRKELILDTGERREAFIYVTPKEEGSFEATLNVRSNGELIHSEEVEIRSGGRDRQEPLMTRLRLWLKYL